MKSGNNSTKSHELNTKYWCAFYQKIRRWGGWHEVSPPGQEPNYFGTGDHTKSGNNSTKSHELNTKSWHVFRRKNRGWGGQLHGHQLFNRNKASRGQR